MKKKMSRKHNGVGGARERSGRPPTLVDPKRLLFRLEASQLDALDGYVKRHDVKGGRNEALRQILDGFLFD